MSFRNLLQAISRRGALIIFALIIGIGVILTWFIVSGVTPTGVQVTIGIAAISAFFAAISSMSNLLQAVETERQRRNQDRPYVNAYFDTSSGSLITFVVENSGNSPAKNIHLKIDPAPVDYAGRKLSDVSFFSQPISFLPTGKKLRQIVDVGYRVLAEGKPVNFRVSARYESIYGETFRENTSQNLEYLRQTTAPGKSIEEGLGDITKELKELHTLLSRVEKFGALQVETPDQNRLRMEKMILDDQDLSPWRKSLKLLLKKILARV